MFWILSLSVEILWLIIEHLKTLKNFWNYHVFITFDFCHNSTKVWTLKGFRVPDFSPWHDFIWRKQIWGLVKKLFSRCILFLTIAFSRVFTIWVLNRKVLGLKANKYIQTQTGGIVTIQSWTQCRNIPRRDVSDKIVKGRMIFCKQTQFEIFFLYSWSCFPNEKQTFDLLWFFLYGIWRNINHVTFEKAMNNLHQTIIYTRNGSLVVLSITWTTYWSPRGNPRLSKTS